MTLKLLAILFKTETITYDSGRHDGRMVSALVSSSSGPGLNPSWEHYVVFLGKKLYSHGASLHPGV